MEKNVLPRPEVVREIDKFIPVELYVDRPTDLDRKNQKLMQELAGSVAMPIYAIVSPDGKLVKLVQGSRSSTEFVMFLKSAQEQTRRIAQR